MGAFRTQRGLAVGLLFDAGLFLLNIWSFLFSWHMSIILSDISWNKLIKLAQCIHSKRRACTFVRRLFSLAVVADYEIMIKKIFFPCGLNECFNWTAGLPYSCNFCFCFCGVDHTLFGPYIVIVIRMLCIYQITRDLAFETVCCMCNCNHTERADLRQTILTWEKPPNFIICSLFHFGNFIKIRP